MSKGVPLPLAGADTDGLRALLPSYPQRYGRSSLVATAKQMVPAQT